MNRRRFLAASAAALGGYALCRPTWAAEHAAPAGEFEELDATAPGGIDLFLERRELLIGGRPGRAIAINGYIAEAAGRDARQLFFFAGLRVAF
jgi:hypothetical protein